MTSILKVDEIQNTDGQSALVITPDGSVSGVKFPEAVAPVGRTITSTTMSSYEEGIWTITMEPSSGFTPTDTTSNGYYTKIGNMVTVFGVAEMQTPASLGSWLNDHPDFALKISGLPFNIGDELSRRSAPVLGVANGIGWTSGNALTGHGSNGTGTLSIFQGKASGSPRTSPNLLTSKNHSLHFCFTYTTT